MRTYDPHRSVLQYAYRLLSYRGRSEKEMAMRLRMKGFDEPDIHQTLEQLRENGFLDDRKLAFSLKRYAEESKHLSVSGAKKLLSERGVPADIIKEALRDMNEMEAAQRFLEKKLVSLQKQGFHRPQELTPEAMKKLYGVLYRRGYPSETIKKVLAQFKGKEDTE
jgi:regulatory protein